MSLIISLLYEDAGMLQDIVEKCLDNLIAIVEKKEKEYIKPYSNCIFSILINNSED